MLKKSTTQHIKKKKALSLYETNKLTEAKLLYEQLIAVDNVDPEIWLMLGLINGKQGQYQQAADCLKNAISCRPDYIDAYLKYAVALRFLGEREQAVAIFRKALRLQPDNAEAGDGLAYLLFDLGQIEEAATVFCETLRYHPEKAERHSVYGSVLQAQDLYGEAIEAYKKALRLKPGLSVGANLCSALLAQGRLDEGVEYYRESLTQTPMDVDLYSGLLMALNYIPDIDKQSVFKEHMSWGMTFGGESNKSVHYGNIQNTDRKLQIGYVSPDFRANHSVTYFIEPILRSHNKERFEIYCYSMMPRPDGTTKRLQKYADHWRNIFGWDDERLANQIIADKVDILVDLAGHTAHNSLTTFARKPAPIQITYLGYPNTTGLPAIDYRLTDAVADPEGEDAFYTEKLTRLPGCFLCYQPPEDAPPVNPLPAVEAGHITFGSFNNLTKVNEEVVKLWSRVLKALPGSRLLIKQRALNDPETRKRYSRMFESQGIGSERIELLGHIKDRTGHLALYGKVDIALDTFPYNGTTTTCEALWMGVPVMTLAGKAHASRVSKSLLYCVGLDKWVTNTPEEFVSAVVEYSHDLTRLAELRAGLRNKVLTSPLCDAKGFVRVLETILRKVWQRWCH